MKKYNFESISKKPVQNLLEDKKKKKQKTKTTKKPKTKKAKKVGRPPKAQDKKRTKSICLSVTQDEFKKIQKLCEENYDVTPPTLIRSILKKYNII